MIAFDTDILTGILMGRTAFVERASRIAVDQQAVPVIVIEEIMRGRLNVIRRAEAGKSKVAIDHAYKLFEQTFSDLRRIRMLSYSSQADAVYRWRQGGIRISTHDLRIAAICVAHEAT